MENKILDTTLELLTEQMIKDYFRTKEIGEEKFIITKQDLYDFSMRLISLLIANSKEYKLEKE